MIYIDAHVHLHDCFHLNVFFDHVERNIQRVSQSRHDPNQVSCCLFLTEASNANYFENIRHKGDPSVGNTTSANDGWRVQRTSEPISLLISNEAGFRIYLIAGQQLQTAEGLEVLALAPNHRIVEGKPLKQLISEVVKADGLAVVPWGFGKWLGRRGKVLKAIIQQIEPRGFFLGDNSGRPRFLLEPSMFRLAKQKSIRVLPGSDPLPFASEVRRAGSFGLTLQDEISGERPAEQLKQKLVAPETEFDTFGQLETVDRFIKHQLLMQLVKRQSKRF